MVSTAVLSRFEVGMVGIAGEQADNQGRHIEATPLAHGEHAQIVGVARDKCEWQGMRDEQLMDHVATGNTSAFDELYDRYTRGCFGLAIKIVREPTIAEEVVQDVFMKLWTHPHIFTPERGKFSGWLLTLVHNRSVDKLRRLKSANGRAVLPLEGDSDSDLSLADLLPDSAPTPDEQAWTSEQGHLVRRALDTLPPSQRDALVLAYFGGLTQKEIAEKLQEPLGTIKTRTRSALHHLKHTLAGEGLLGA